MDMLALWQTQYFVEQYIDLDELQSENSFQAIAPGSFSEFMTLVYHQYRAVSCHIYFRCQRKTSRANKQQCDKRITYL